MRVGVGARVLAHSSRSNIDLKDKWRGLNQEKKPKEEKPKVKAKAPAEPNAKAQQQSASSSSASFDEAAEEQGRSVARSLNRGPPAQRKPRYDEVSAASVLRAHAPRLQTILGALRDTQTDAGSDKPGHVEIPEFLVNELRETVDSLEMLQPAFTGAAYDDPPEDAPTAAAGTRTAGRRR